ncbi:MAG: zinc-dependent metalloprotease [Bacteroidota bacterium]|nr:zinc-dependent metalloprotease [Bacteroidota bacterium]
MKTFALLILCLLYLAPTFEVLAQFRCTVVDPVSKHPSEPTFHVLTNAIRGQDITIPVVFHVLWHTSYENVSEEALLEQLNVLNQDFRRTNPDASNTPVDLLGIAGGSNFQFCFADLDPWGNPTNGITRTYTDTVLWLDTWVGNDNIFNDETGGVDPWDQLHYLNIYVFNRSHFAGTASTPQNHGYGYDGVAIKWSHAADANRTLTHEVGHYFGLHHVQGGTAFEVSCGDDYVDDTPLQTFHYDCPTYPFYSCGNTSISDLFMNYMDYSPSECKNMFTVGQVERMVAQFEQYRTSFLEVNGCFSVGFEDLVDRPKKFNLSPNPTNGMLNVSLLAHSHRVSFKLIDAAGRTEMMRAASNFETMITFDVSSLSAGMYLVQALEDDVVIGQERLVVY